MRFIAFIWCYLIVVINVDCRGLNHYSKITQCSAKGPTGDPLFLTRYIDTGRIEDGRRLSQVPPLLDGVDSYSGYFTVNKKYGSNLFFWFFPAETDQQNAPVMLWLQGGPGGPSMFGLFQEHGPFVINNNLTVIKRKYTWTKGINVLYIDNPVGTGFSFTQNQAGYVTNEDEVARDLYAALIQFFQIFTHFQNNQFYVSGESYAGKYIPAIAYYIHINNPTSPIKINLQGIAIGDGLVDPENMMHYGDYLIQHGLIDQDGLQKFHALEQKIKVDIENKNFAEAYRGFDQLFVLLKEIAGEVDVYNYLIDGKNEISGEILSNFLCQSHIRKRIHVGNLTFNDGTTVHRYLEMDMMKSVRPWLEVLMEHYSVLLYSGQLDIIVAYPLTINFVEKLEWSGAAEYKAAKRQKWFVGGHLAGYSKSARNFTELLVRDAGHMVPSDQPEWAFDMITKFVTNKPF